MKDNLGQECVNGGLLSFLGKTGTIAPDFLGKNDRFSSFDPTFQSVSHFYIFEMSNNKAIR